MTLTTETPLVVRVLWGTSSSYFMKKASNLELFEAYRVKEAGEENKKLIAKECDRRRISLQLHTA